LLTLVAGNLLVIAQQFAIILSAGTKIIVIIFIVL
jgi:hypothetical protein